MYIVVKQHQIVHTETLIASSQPRVHLTRSDAETEAKRLASLTPLNNFIVMEAVSMARQAKPVTPPVELVNIVN